MIAAQLQPNNKAASLVVFTLMSNSAEYTAVPSSAGRTGQIALPPDEDSLPLPQSDGLRKFRRRALGVLGVILFLTLAGYWELTPHGERPIDELAHSVDIAYDPRLERYQSPEDAESCTEWPLKVDSSSSAKSSMSFELPTTADLLFFLSRGPVSGHVEIIKSPRSSSGPIEVILKAHSSHSEDLKRTKVCRMGQSGSNEHGILIWGEPHHPHGVSRRDVRFEMTITVPTGIREYKDVTTDLARFSHSVDDFFDLWSPTTFRMVRMKSSEATIDHGSLVAVSAFFQTSNARVEGFFSGTEKLSVMTSNSPIKTVALMNGAATGSEVDVNIQTSNGEIDVSLGIMTDHPKIVLRAALRTSNAPLKIDMPRHMGADNSSFFLQATTSNGAAQLRLPDEYEGTYNLRTSHATAKVVVMDEDITDPLGMLRHRTLQKTSTGSYAQGFMFWSHDGGSPEGIQRGSVAITTTNSPITMWC